MKSENQQSRAARLVQNRALVRTKDFTAAGVTRTTVRRLCSKGAIEQVARGLYRAPNATLSENASLVEAQVRVPGAVVCLLSALRFHGMTTQNPASVWLAVDRKARKPQLAYPPVEVVRFSRPHLEAGVATHVIDGVHVRITTPSRTVVDCFHYRNKIGIDVAVEALRDYLRHKRGSLDELLANAKLVSANNVMRPYIEALT